MRVSIPQPCYVLMALLVGALFVSILMAMKCTNWYDSLRDVLRASALIYFAVLLRLGLDIAGFHFIHCVFCLICE